MNKDIAIKVENLSKVYKLYNAPIDRMKEALHPFKKNYHKEFYALNNINFDIRKGECVGVIGRNGAGKSTLLKIITGVLNPTHGRVVVNGKIASLLELGTGFNPEYTGLENIYFQGNLMGFTKEDMDAKLNKILDFADIGDFIYQPVKNYSSGMYVRLAFACSINVDPDVLIVDEALSVGDARFQLKCFKRLDEIKQSGATIIFVSHSIDQIKSLCSRGILIDNGTMLYDGDPKSTGVKYFDLLFPNQEQDDNEKGFIGSSQAVANSNNKLINQNMNYIDGYKYTISKDILSSAQVFGHGGARITNINIYGLDKPNVFHGGDKIRVEVTYSWDIEAVAICQIENNLVDDIGLGIALADQKGNYIFGCNNYDFGMPISYKDKDHITVILDFDMPYLQSGSYFITIAISLGTQINHVQLRWYDCFVQLECQSKLKNIYGVLHIPSYQMNYL